MSFLLAGFKDRNGARYFAFDCVAADHSKKRVMVGADIMLARKHEILLQELPLHCVRLLETLRDDQLAGAVTLTEDRMTVIQIEAHNAAARKTHKSANVPVR